MSMQSRSLPEFQRAILQNALTTKNREIWLPKEAADTLPATYSALIKLQKRKLIELVPVEDQEVVRWKVTKTGREAARQADATRPAPASAPRAGPRPSLGRLPAAARPAAASRPTGRADREKAKVNKRSGRSRPAAKQKKAAPKRG